MPEEFTNPADGSTISDDDNIWVIGEGLTGVKIVDISNK